MSRDIARKVRVPICYVPLIITPYRVGIFQKLGRIPDYVALIGDGLKFTPTCSNGVAHLKGSLIEGSTEARHYIYTSIADARSAVKTIGVSGQVVGPEEAWPPPSQYRVACPPEVQSSIAPLPFSQSGLAPPFAILLAKAVVALCYLFKVAPKRRFVLPSSCSTENPLHVQYSCPILSGERSRSSRTIPG